MWPDLQPHEKQALSPDLPDNAIDSIERGWGDGPTPGVAPTRREAGSLWVDPGQAHVVLSADTDVDYSVGVTPAIIRPG